MVVMVVRVDVVKAMAIVVACSGGLNEAIERRMW